MNQSDRSTKPDKDYMYRLPVIDIFQVRKVRIEKNRIIKFD